MTNAFDSMFLPGGGDVLSHDDLLNFDNFQSTDFTTIHGDGRSHDGTISPQDLLRDDSMVMSAPPSTAFPNLSTPESGYLESPAMASSSLNTSPLEDGLLDGTLNFSELESMAPLFPPNSYDQFGPQGTAENSRFASVNTRPSSDASPMARQKSSPGRPPSLPFGHARKLSATSGIVKSASKSRKALPEITIDSEDDKETAKRKKNTAAARKSRQRKQELAEAAEMEIQRLRTIIIRLGADPDTA